MEMKVCAACGSDVSATSRFCYRCGATQDSSSGGPPEGDDHEDAYGGATYDFGRTEPSYRPPPPAWGAETGRNVQAATPTPRVRSGSIVLPLTLGLSGLAVGVLLVLIIVRTGGTGEPTPTDVALSPDAPHETATVQNPTVAPQPDPTAETTPLPSAASTPIPTPPTDPNYVMLLSYIPLSYGLCEHAPDQAEPGSLATVRCSPGNPVALAFFDLFPSREAVDAALDNYAGTRTGGRCESGPYVGEWAYGEESPPAGELVCYYLERDNRTDSVIVWSDWELNVLGQIFRLDRGMPQLYKWWTDSSLLYP